MNRPKKGDIGCHGDCAERRGSPCSFTPCPLACYRSVDIAIVRLARRRAAKSAKRGENSGRAMANPLWLERPDQSARSTDARSVARGCCAKHDHYMRQRVMIAHITNRGHPRTKPQDRQRRRWTLRSPRAPTGGSPPRHEIAARTPEWTDRNSELPRAGYSDGSGW